MLRYRLKTGTELSADEIATWRGLQSDRLDFASPYFAPEFFLRIAEVTTTARVLVLEMDGKPVGFLPHHRRAGGLGSPIGSYLCDIHGLIAPELPELDTNRLMRVARLSLLPWRHAPVGQAALTSGPGNRHAFHIVDLRQGMAAYESSQKLLAKSAMRTLRVRREKAVATYGSVTHVFADADPANLARLLEWKTAQFRATRQPNVFGHGWVMDLVHRLHAATGERLRGQLSCLYFGDQLAAAHFGLRTNEVLHYWFPGYDPKFAELSPGNMLLHAMLTDAAAAGCHSVHLGPGEYRYKHEFANACIPVMSGIVYGHSLPGRAAMAAEHVLHGVERLLPQRLSKLPAKAIRRLDRRLAFQV